LIGGKQNPLKEPWTFTIPQSKRKNNKGWRFRL